MIACHKSGPCDYQDCKPKDPRTLQSDKIEPQVKEHLENLYQYLNMVHRQWIACEARITELEEAGSG